MQHCFLACPPSLTERFLLSLKQQCSDNASNQRQRSFLEQAPMGP